MATFYAWRNKYRRFVDDSAWNLITLGLIGYPSGVLILPKANKDAREFDIYEFLCPEIILHGFFIAGSCTESVDLSPKELAKDILKKASSSKGEGISQEELEQKINEIVKKKVDEEKYNKAVEAFEQIREPEKIAEMLIRAFKYREKEWNWTSLANWFEKLKYIRIAKLGADRDYIRELERFFSHSGKNGWFIDSNMLLRFTINFMFEKKEEEEKGDFAETAGYFVELQKKITEKVICQDTAVRKLISGLFNGKLKKECDRTGPESSFLFVGPPGVGKTFLAQTAAELSGRPSKIFMMSEYANDSSFHGLVGFEPTWKDSKQGDLTAYVSQNENAVLIFDEIEKAHINTIHLFLSILEGGSLTDLYTQQDVDFRQTIVIFTTNAGRDFYEEKRGMSISALSEATLIDALKADKRSDGKPLMPPEILSRLSKGNIIGFDHMNPAKLVPIIKEGMKKGASAAEEIMGLECRYDSSVLPYLFLFHMGGSIDARVASARSESFVKDGLFRIAERVGEDAKQYKKITRGKDHIQISFEVEKDETASDLTERKKQAELLVVCNTTERSMLKSRKYKCHYVYAEKESDDYQSYIEDVIKNHEIDAILVDPLMREKKSDGEEQLEGLSHKNTAGNRVIEFLLTKTDYPPVFCVEFRNQYISYVDQQDLYQRGINGIIRLSQAKNQEEREEMIDNLCYELFLAEKLDQLTSRGRALEFDVGHRIESDKDIVRIRLYLCHFRLVRSMDSQAQEIFISDEIRNTTSFDDVIGADSAKEELRRFVKFIKKPEEYRKSGQQVSKGILMYGPPGSGKTMLARALACEADCPFISATGTQFVMKEKTLTEVFRLARKYAPSIVFIDEIESFAIDSRAGTQYPAILKQLLTEMDGFDKSSKPVFVIAATNAGNAPSLGERNIMLDEALLRRFTKKVYMKWPDRKERIAFMQKRKKELAGLQYGLDCLTDKDIEYFADVSAGTSLSEISNVLSVAAGRAAELEVKITKDLLITCFEEFVYGEKKDYALEHIRITAVHEAGHAFMGFYCDNFTSGRFTPEYATIISRGSYLGLVRQKRNEMRTGYSKDELIMLIRIKLAGRAAEMVFATENGGGLTTGASNDLEHATDIAAEILSDFGMEEGFLATLPMETMMNSALAQEYYSKLNGILQRELDETIRIITENKDQVQALADALCDRSKLDTEEMREIIDAVRKSETEKTAAKKSAAGETEAGRKAGKKAGEAAKED